MVELPTEAEPVRVVEGDCLEAVRALPDASVDCVVTDPPYPHIKREYGFWTEAEWFALMNPLVEECRRVLKPTGSAVFVLQPNSERVGRMRTWLWKFMAKWGDEWGQVQDAYWWNHAAMPNGGATDRGMLRASIKPCVWLGPADCYRDQDSVLWSESDENKRRRLAGRCGKFDFPSGNAADYARIGAAAERRGGVTPFNLIPVPGVDEEQSKSAGRHPGMTPRALARWWVRYICPPGGTVLEPFLGSGTVALAALAEGRRCIGVERMPKYVEIARKRVADARKADGLFAV